MSGRTVRRVIRVVTIEPGKYYQIHELVDGKHEGGADVRGDARVAAKRARALANGATIEWVKR